MVKQLLIEDFFAKSINSIIIDVRTPLEFNNGHIIDSINLPIFSNEERVEVGTIYKNKGRKDAIKRGLELVGKKLANIISDTEHNNPLKKDIIVYCWRGGMRSSSIAWLLDLYGFNVFVIKGGYKTYRKYALNFFENKFKFVVIGGKTGSGKTEIIENLKNNNLQIIDLERLANHKGSSFGHLGQNKQYKNEHFENLIFHQLIKLNLSNPIFIENESQKIGVNFIPNSLFSQIRNAPLINIEITKDERIQRLVEDYSTFSFEELKSSLVSISKRLGGQNLKLAVEALESKNFKLVVEIALKYYDKTYEYGLSIRDSNKVFHLSDKNLSIENIERIALEYYERN